MQDVGEISMSKKLCRTTAGVQTDDITVMSEPLAHTCLSLWARWRPLKPRSAAMLASLMPCHSDNLLTGCHRSATVALSGRRDKETMSCSCSAGVLACSIEDLIQG